MISSYDKHTRYLNSIVILLAICVYGTSYPRVREFTALAVFLAITVCGLAVTFYAFYKSAWQVFNSARSQEDYRYQLSFICSLAAIYILFNLLGLDIYFKYVYSEPITLLSETAYRWLSFTLNLCLIILMPTILILSRGFNNKLHIEFLTEPAQISYIFGQIYIDYYNTIYGTTLKLITKTQALSKYIIRYFRAASYFYSLMFWPASVFLLSVFMLGSCLFVATLLLLSLSLGIYFVSLTLGGLVLIAFLYPMERMIWWVKSLTLKCPSCHKKISHPIYSCSSSLKHYRLFPGLYGIFHRVSFCGEKLATSILFGKSALACECPHCGYKLDKHSLPANIHIPIVGPHNSGKTTYVKELSHALTQRYIPGVKAQLKAYSQEASILKLQYKNSLPVNCHIYDIPSQLTLSQDNLRRHSRFQNADAIALIIDSNTLIQQNSQGNALYELTSRILRVLAEGQIQRRVAIILTKAESERFKQLTGVSDDGWVTHNISKKLENWLYQAQPALFNEIKCRVDDICFFAVSAKKPDGIIQPFLWLVSAHRILRYPAWTRFEQKALEVLAGFCVPVTLLAGLYFVYSCIF